MESKRHFGTLKFEGQEEITLVQHALGLGKGTIIKCVLCEVNVDDILDNPNKHHENCNKNL